MRATVRAYSRRVVAGVVVAGGAGRRIGGVDKAMVAVAGTTMLERVLTAARPVADRLVVVGPPRPTRVDEVEFIREAQPGGGPVPAVLAGLERVGDADIALVLAVDLPLLTPAELERLLFVLRDQPELEAVAAVDGRGRVNPLLAAYRVGSVRAAAGASGPGTPAARLLPPALGLVEVGDAALNVNRMVDLQRAVAVLEERDEPLTPGAARRRRRSWSRP
jgi:molybdopterin-guanine dinucleotide biosynthesis protein A